jgi:hypothetical protein
MDFKQAEERFKQLKAQFETGTLRESEFKIQLKELMLLDAQGNWWMIGYETEQWYRHDGKNWVRTDPPGYVSQISTQKPLKQDTGTAVSRTKFDDQRSFWKIGKKEVIQSAIGLGVFTLLFLLGRSDPTFRYWSPAFAVPLFFGLVFGPMVGAIVGAGGYIIETALIFQSDFSSMFSNIGLIAFAIEGAIMGFAKTSVTGYSSIKSILQVELFIILASLARILVSTNLVGFFSNPPSSGYFTATILYPLFGNLIIVPISLVVYLFILTRRKQTL